MTTAEDLREPAPLPWRRVMSWLIRRELWEHRAVLVAPVIVAGVGMIGFLLSTIALPSALRAVAAGDRAHRALVLGPYSFMALAVLLIGLLVAATYSLGALQGERRDRSLLFWKSLPVSDGMTVLSKAAVPILVTPVVTFAVVFAAQLLMLAWSTLVVVANGISPMTLWAQVKLDTMWLVLPYGLVINALWQAPVYAWFLLVSAWSRRMPILWALGPFLAPALIEAMAFRTSHVGHFMVVRFLGGLAQAFSVGGKAQQAVDSVSQLDPGHILAEPDIWVGLLFAAAFLAAAAWLRRRREPN